MVAVEAQAAGTPVVASTAVPRECVVLPELVQFVPLTKSFKEWSEVVIRTIEHGRPETMSCNRRVADSEFAIKNSALRLQKVYKQGTS